MIMTATVTYNRLAVIKRKDASIALRFFMAAQPASPVTIFAMLVELISIDTEILLHAFR